MAPQQLLTFNLSILNVRLVIYPLINKWQHLLKEKLVKPA